MRTRHVTAVRGTHRRCYGPSVVFHRSGRPPATSHAAIEAAAFALFAERGFDDTTAEEIAEAVGVSRRTLFRYFPSKNDIPWGRFDESLAGFRQTLRALPLTQPVARTVQEAVVAFNTFNDGSIPAHRARMSLILRTPSLQAHSVLMYARWRQVITEYVAERTGTDPAGLAVQTVGHVSLALAVAAYEDWLRHPAGTAAGLRQALADSMAGLRAYLDDGRALDHRRALDHDRALDDGRRTSVGDLGETRRFESGAASC